MRKTILLPLLSCACVWKKHEGITGAGVINNVNTRFTKLIKFLVEFISYESLARFLASSHKTFMLLNEFILIKSN